MAVKVNSYDIKGDKQVETLTWLSQNQKAKPGLIAQVIRVFQGNQRRGMAIAKTRGQVTGTTKKIYKQKGTGGARHGSRKAPIFVGGGKAHGPTGGQNYSGQINKKVITKALLSALIDKQTSGQLALVNCPDFTKSAQAAKYFSTILTDNKSHSSLLIVDSKTNGNCIKYGRNLAKTTIQSAQTVSAYEIIKADLVLLSNQSLPILQHRGELK